MKYLQKESWGSHTGLITYFCQHFRDRLLKEKYYPWFIWIGLFGVNTIIANNIGESKVHQTTLTTVIA